MTLSITTLRIKTLGKITFSIMTLGDKKIMKLSIKTLIITKLA